MIVGADVNEGLRPNRLMIWDRGKDLGLTISRWTLDHEKGKTMAPIKGTSTIYNFKIRDEDFNI